MTTNQLPVRTDLVVPRPAQSWRVRITVGSLPGAVIRGTVRL